MFISDWYDHVRRIADAQAQRKFGYKPPTKKEKEEEEEEEGWEEEEGEEDQKQEPPVGK